MPLLAALAASGCFEDSPAVDPESESDDDESDDDESDDGESSTADSESDDEGPDPDDTAGDSETTGPSCDAETPALFLNDVDLVVGIDPELAMGQLPPAQAIIDTLANVLASEGLSPNIALLGAPGLIVDVECEMACNEGCGETQSSIYAQLDAAPASPLDIFVDPGVYECMLRPHLPMASPPTVQYVLFTPRDSPPDSGPLFDLLEERNAFFQVACPGCETGGPSPLEQIASTALGLSVNLTNPEEVAALANYAASPRIECAWLAEPPEGHTVDELTVHIESEFFDGPAAELQRVDTSEDCNPVGIGDPISDNEWFLVDAGGQDIVALCPSMCLATQLVPGSFVTVTHEYCG